MVPDVCVALHEHFREGRHAEARALQRRLTPLAKLVTTGLGVAGPEGRDGPRRLTPAASRVARCAPRHPMLSIRFDAELKSGQIPILRSGLVPPGFSGGGSDIEI